MHKKNVLGVVRIPYSAMGEMHYTSKDSGVYNVSGLLSGKYAITAPFVFSTGSGSGLPRVALSSYFVNCPVIVDPNLILSRITGWGRCQRRKWTTLRFNIWSTMPPTFTRTAVC